MSSPVGQRSVDASAVLAGGGEMGERTRSFDWSTTSVGPVAKWPQSLKTAVRIMLASRYAMWLGWGSDLTFFYNDAYARMTLGPKHPWALGRSAREVWSEIWNDIGPRAESVVRTGTATWDNGLLLFLERQGFPEETYHTFSYSPLPDDDGGIGGMLCVVTEDTERTIGERRLRTLRELAARTTIEAKSVEEACQATIQSLAENPHDLPFVLIYLLDSQSRFAFLAGSTGLSDGRAVPQRIDLDDETTRQSGWPLWSVLQTGRPQIVPDLASELGPLPAGIWPESIEQAVVLPISKPGQSQLAGFVVAAVSPRLPFDDRYMGFFDLLANQVGTTVTNARAYEEERRRAESLAELDRAKTVFFSNVSHEFRTPLSLMLGPVEEILTSDQSLSASSRTQLQIVNNNGRRLLRLVNSLLDFSRIEAGRVRANYQPTDLSALTADLASVFRAACDKAGLKLKVDCPHFNELVYVDREMWEKIVLNLLSNAFKFTLEGEIEIRLIQTDTHVELTLRDTGTGIPAAEMPRLFERFYRVENARGRTHEGSGIGLALVQELVKLHAGSITAQSTEGEGTTFTVKLSLGSAHLPKSQVETGRQRTTSDGINPYVEEAMGWLPATDNEQVAAVSQRDLDDISTESNSDTCDDHDDTRPKILIADDNADMRTYMERLLSGTYRVETVADGVAALKASRQRTPDLLLTDVMMPQMDGFGLLKEWRSNSATRNVPVIMLSAQAGDESRFEAMKAGVDDYVVKPFSARELHARIAAHLQMARIRRESNEILQQSEERLRMALTAARMVAWQFDPVANTVVLSDNADDVLGLTEDIQLDTIEQTFALLHDEDVERHRAAVMSAVEENGSYLIQSRMIRPDNGSVQWLEDRGRSVNDGTGNRARLIGVVMDITDRKQAEEELLQADRQKDEFLATFAHELRNPLAPLRNGLQLMKLARNNTALVEQSQAMMERQLGQMVRLIDDLLDVNRISRGKLELKKERIELATVIHNAVETASPLIEQSSHELSVSVPHDPIYIDGDMTRLSQVFANLLNNAAKFTDRGGRIWLKVERHNSEVVVTVKDTGVGIPPQLHRKVFEMFTQVDRSLEKSQGGLGIGLTLVQRLVQMHGGSVSLQSEGQGTGSEFTVRLPIDMSLVRESFTTGDAVATNARRRIMVVDDNHDAAASLSMMMQYMGNETQIAHDGVEAVRLASVFRPDVILLDIGMPRMNGYDTARCIRQESWGKDIVLVALTGWGQEEDRRKSHEAGFDAHMVKPIEPAAIEKLLANLQLHRA